MGLVRATHGSRFRRRAGRLLLALAALLAVAAVVERRQEATDFERYAGHETFADISGGARVRYRLLGTDQPGPTVVLLNGINSCLEEWDPVQTGVARFAPVLAFDGAGTGFSSGASVHDANGQADEIAQLVKAVGIQGKLVLVGYSASGSLARVFAARHRELSAGTVLLAPYLPEMDVLYPERRSELRSYARFLAVGTAEALFGFRRAALHLGWLHAPHVPPTARDSRALAVQFRVPHWLAVDRQVLASKDSAEQALASHTGEPLLVLRSNKNDVPHYPEYVDQFTAAHHGELRIIDGVEHSQLLTDARSVNNVVEGIQALASRTRSR
ncbi:MAG: alpha/beta hydrolase [Polyangiaceae bacterium]